MKRRLQFEYFFRGLSSSDRIALVHDTDADGITSGKIICEALRRTGRQIQLFLTLEHDSHALTAKMIKLLKTNKINILFTTDKTVDSDPISIKKIEKFAQICVFDHHVIENDISSERTIFLKPQLLFKTPPPDQYCSAKFSFDLLRKVAPIEDLKWVCAAGIIGDTAQESWKNFMEDVFEHHDLSSNALQNKIGQLTQLINYAEARGEAKESFNLLLQANSLDSALEKLSNYSIVQKEVDHYYNNFSKLAQSFPQLFFLELNTTSKIKSWLSSRVAYELYPHHTIIVTQQQNKEFGISARRVDRKVKVNELLQKSLLGLRGRAGGHHPAAGGSVHQDDYEKFKENVIRNAALSLK